MKHILYSGLIFLVMLFLCLGISVQAIDTSNMNITFDGEGELIVDNISSVDEHTDTAEQQNKEMENRYNKYITVIGFVTAIATITMLGVFIKHVVHFASLGAEHWIVRRNAMIGLLWSGIAFALLGSATLILGLVYNAFSF